MAFALRQRHCLSILAVVGFRGLQSIARYGTSGARTHLRGI